MKTMHAAGRDASGIGYLVRLAALDTLDRLRILQAEIRHLQENIVYALGSDHILAQLAKEECAVEKTLSEDVGDHVDPRNFHEHAREKVEHILPLPDFLQQDPAWAHRRLSDASWVDESRRELYFLDALQALLRRCVYLHELMRLWYRWAVMDPAERCGVFFLARTGIQHELYHIVPRLGDLQRQHEGALDLAQTEQHRPIGSRRRLQGVYSRVLQDSARAWRDAIDELLGDLLGRDTTGLTGSGRPRRVLTHRWLHDRSSRYHRLLPLPGISEDKADERPVLEFVNSSYWMPDRPDLQPQIVHEVAHLALDQRLDIRHHPTRLERFDGSLAGLFTRWWSMIHATTTGIPRDPEPWLPFRQPLHIAELAADILAATVAGPAYLHALFLDLVGRDLERWLAAPDSTDISLERIADHVRMPEAGGRLQNHAPFLDWYVRLRLVAAWIDRVHPPPAGQNVLLTSAVRELCDRVVQFVRERTHPVALPFVRYWDVTASALEREIHGRRGVPRRVRRWVEERQLGFGRVWQPPSREALLPPRFLRPFPKEVPPFLRAAGGWAHDGEVPRFAALRDVPWEAIWAHLAFPPQLPEGRRLDPFAEARRLHQLALEFHLWETRRPWYRLSDAVATVQQVLGSSGQATRLPAELRGRLVNWLRGKEEEEGAIQRLRVRPVVPTESATERGRDPGRTAEVDRRHGRKLADLGRILDAYGEALPAELRQLRDWLALHDPGKHAEARRRIVRAIRTPFGGSHGKGDGELFEAIRGSVAGDAARRIPAFRDITTVVVKPDVPARGKVSFSTLLRPGAGDEKGRRRQVVALGRFDLIVVEVAGFDPYARFLAWEPQEDGSLKRYEGGDDCFAVPYSRRIETGLRTSLAPQASDDVSRPADRQETGCESLAAVAIVLRDRAQRLDFVARLLQAVDTRSSGTGRGRDSATSHLVEDHVHVLGPDDILYLTEGTGDVLVVFRIPACWNDPEGRPPHADVAGRLGEVMRFTIAAFEDFMVERTELVLFASALWAVVERPDRFHVQLRVRLQEKPRQYEVRRYLGHIQPLAGSLLTNAALLSGTDDVLIDIDGEKLGARCQDRTPVQALNEALFDPKLVSNITTVLRFPEDVLAPGPDAARS